MSEGPLILPPLIVRMLSRDFYPHRTADQIRLVQTHISYVLLTGEHVYKVKKPVKLPFLDFSTLECRRHFCDEELRLNRRGAAEIYVEVVAIMADGDQVRLNGTGATIEYAVKMRQFAQEALFSSLLSKGLLDAGRIQGLAKTVAEYHAAAPSDESIARFGRPELIRKSIEDNYRQTARYVGGLQTKSQFEQTKHYTDRFFDDCSDLLAQRVEGGRVREGHGDLHLGNICMWEGKILLFDCIEFNQSLRCVDVMNDAAFTAMDLEAGGRPDLASLFLNEYAEHTGDWEGVQVLPLYLCTRAYVRAMVHSLLLDEPELSPDEREKARRAAEAYYHLAWQYTRPRQGGIVLVSGLSGSGKSTLARFLAQHTKAAHIRSDAVRKHLAGVSLGQRGGPELYTAEMARATYARLLELGLLLARRGFWVILDARYGRAAARREAIDRARAAGLAAVRIFHCVAPDDVMRARLASRRDDVSDATPEILDRQRAEFEPFAEEERENLTVVDTTRPIDLAALGI